MRETAKYMLYTKNITWAKITLFAAQQKISLGKFFNILLDNIAETINPEGDLFLTTSSNPVFSREALLKICKEARIEAQTKKKNKDQQMNTASFW